MKILVTGGVAAGKSTVAGELQKRGFIAYDADSLPGLSRWEDDQGNEVQPLENPPRDWFTNHHWNWQAEKLKELLQAEATVFVCGSSSNFRGFLELFDEVILLEIAIPELAKRVATRSTNDFGKNENEMEDIKSWHDWFQETIKDYGASVIEATKPLEDVIDEIVKLTNEG